MAFLPGVEYPSAYRCPARAVRLRRPPTGGYLLAAAPGPRTMASCWIYWENIGIRRWPLQFTL